MLKSKTLLAGFLLMVWMINFNGKLNMDKTAEQLIEKEKAALDRWIKGDVWGYLELFAKDASYIDQTTSLKLNGYKSIEDYIAPFNGKIFAHEYEMTNVSSIVNDNLCILAFNLYIFNEQRDTIALWNTTEVFKNYNSEWKIAHSHWSLVNIQK